MLPPDADPDRRRDLTRWIDIGLLTLGDQLAASAFLRQALGQTVADLAAGRE